MPTSVVDRYVVESHRRATFPDLQVPGQPGATLTNNHERRRGIGTFHGPTDVTFPTLIPFRPKLWTKSAATGLIVLPGGAFKFLSHGKESTEVCRFFVMRSGVTCFAVQYRVPFWTEKLPWGVAPLLDAQRAVGVVRHNLSAEFNLNPSRVGVLGLSAGGFLLPQLFATCGGGGETPRAYARIDRADDVSCRPDFSVLIYPFYLACEGNVDMASKLDASTRDFLSMITGWPGKNLDDPLRANAPTELPGYLYTGQATMLRLPACAHTLGSRPHWVPAQAGERQTPAVLNPAAFPPPELLGKHPPTFIAAESTDPVAMVGGELYLRALRNGSRTWNFRPDQALGRYSVRRSDRAELHVWNTSNAHGRGAACAMTRIHSAPPKPEESSMCEAWPFVVATWLAQHAM